MVESNIPTVSVGGGEKDLDRARDLRSMLSGGRMRMEDVSERDLDLLNQLETLENILGGIEQEDAAAQALVPVFEGMNNEQLEQMQAQTAFAAASDPAPAIAPVSAPVSAPQQTAQPRTASSSGSASAKSTSRQSAASSPFSSLKDYDDYLQGQLETARNELRKANLELHSVDAKSDKFPGESKDLQLMRALSDQIKQEGGQSYSNIAAQLAMVQDANFAPVFDREVSKRVNSARKYFGRAGQIQRAAQGEKAAYNQYRQRVRSRSDARAKSLAKTIAQLEKARFQVLRTSELERGKDRRGAQRSAIIGQSMRGSIEIPKRLTTATRQRTQLSQLLEKANDPKSAVEKGVYRKIAEQLTGKNYSDDQSAVKTIKARIRQLDTEIATLSKVYAQGTGANRLAAVLANPGDLGSDESPDGEPSRDAFDDLGYGN